MKTAQFIDTQNPLEMQFIETLGVHVGQSAKAIFNIKKILYDIMNIKVHAPVPSRKYDSTPVVIAGSKKNLDDLRRVENILKGYATKITNSPQHPEMQNDKKIMASSSGYFKKPVTNASNLNKGGVSQKKDQTIRKIRNSADQDIKLKQSIKLQTPQKGMKGSQKYQILSKKQITLKGAQKLPKDRVLMRSHSLTDSVFSALGNGPVIQQNIQIECHKIEVISDYQHCLEQPIQSQIKLQSKNQNQQLILLKARNKKCLQLIQGLKKNLLF